MMPDDDCEETEMTFVIPHYAVSAIGAKATVNTTGVGPPTYLYGKHAQTTAELLQLDGIDHTEIVTDKSRLRILQAQKVLWASCLWLLCHSCQSNKNTTSATAGGGKEGSSSITVSDVHVHYAAELEALVREMWPSFQRIVKQNKKAAADNNEDDSSEAAPSFQKTMDYLRAYSNSIPNAMPSIHLALSELEHRNGIFASSPSNYNHQQPLHQKLIRQVAGPSAMHIFDARQGRCDGDGDVKDEESIKVLHSSRSGGHSSVDNDVQPERRIIVDLQETIGVTLSGGAIKTNVNVNNLKSSSTSNKRVVIVGAGVMGSAIAYNLARRMKRNDPSSIQSIVVVDGSSSSESDVGPTTRASWAWLNANRKKPASYQMLNCLGMHAWRHDPVLQKLPVWNGSLVRLEQPLDCSDLLATGFYSKAIGPLTVQECQELEPNANLFSGGIQNDDNNNRNSDNEGYVYSFPNEGFVDPGEAVQVLRKVAMDLGVQFLWNHNVTRVLCSGSDSSTNGHVTGIECIRHSLVEEAEESSSSPSLLAQLEADCIVVAAGIGSAATWLGGLPMQYSPGSIAFAQPNHRPPRRQGETDNNDDENPVRLKRILVDTIQQSHVLQRENGSIAIGGGVLELGCKKVDFSASSSGNQQHQISAEIKQEEDDESLLLLSGARRIAPRLLQHATFSHTASALRPIPRDGLPSVGYVRPGLYSAVSHSAFTLAPLFGAAVAAEISRDVNLDLLAPYRPNRLFS
jgi:glycine/D-amino acid oxidase-like deaminating enzyme